MKIYKYKTPQRNTCAFYEMLFNSGNHALLAGTTGSGKSVLLNNGIIYLMNNNTPASLQFIFIDPKQVELMQYKDSRYNLRTACSIREINTVLSDLIQLMESRYKQMQRQKLKQSKDKKIIVIVDEVADIFTAYGKDSKQALQYISILLAKARAANIHFILATQAPNRRTLPANIVLNCPTRCALRCMTSIESKQIINQAGAEMLPKYGQALLLSPDLMQVTKYEVKKVSDEIIEASIKAWEPGGYMVIK